MTETCVADVPHVDYKQCDPCVDSYLTYTETTYPIIGGQTWACTLVRRYRWRTCHVGLGVGRHAYSLTLLPGEETELEIVRRERFSRALHEQTSVEQELEFEVQETVRDEWGRKSDASYSSNRKNNWSVFGQKRQTIREYRESVEAFERTMTEVVSKAAASVSSKYETSIDVKAEVENRYRSVRKVANPNPCQPVSYHFYQLMKVIKRELFLVEQSYHCSPPAGIAPPPPSVTSYVTPPGRPQNLRPQVVAPPPAWSLAADAVARRDIDRGVDEDRKEATRVDVPFDQPAIKERSRSQVIEDVRQLEGDEAAREMEAHISQIDDIADPSGGGLIFSQEVCIGTDGFHVEGQVSACAVCEDTELKRKELECKKAELELDKLKCEIKLREKQVKKKTDD